MAMCVLVRPLDGVVGMIQRDTAERKRIIGMYQVRMLLLLLLLQHRRLTPLALLNDGLAPMVE